MVQMEAGVGQVAVEVLLLEQVAAFQGRAIFKDLTPVYKAPRGLPLQVSRRDLINPNKWDLTINHTNCLLLWISIHGTFTSFHF